MRFLFSVKLCTYGLPLCGKLSTPADSFKDFCTHVSDDFTGF